MYVTHNNCVWFCGQLHTLSDGIAPLKLDGIAPLKLELHEKGSCLQV